MNCPYKFYTQKELDKVKELFPEKALDMCFQNIKYRAWREGYKAASKKEAVNA